MPINTFIIRPSLATPPPSGGLRALTRRNVMGIMYNDTAAGVGNFINRRENIRGCCA